MQVRLLDAGGRLELGQRGQQAVVEDRADFGHRVDVVLVLGDRLLGLVNGVVEVVQVLAQQRSLLF